MLSEKFTPSYPRMTQLKAQIEEMKRNLAEQRTQAIRALEAAYNADLETENQLKKQLEDQKQKAFDLSRREVQYNIMKREYESLKDLYQSVLRQVKESQMASESPGSNVALSEFAAPPAKHASPRGLLSILLSLVLGPLFGFILALIQEVLDDTIKTVEDAKEVLQAGNLGIVPNYTQQAVTGDPHHSSALEWKEGNTREPAANIQFPAGGPLAGDSLWTPAPAVQPVLPVRRRRRSTSAITVVTPTSITSEAFRTVRTAIMLSSAERPPKTILVTSPKKSEGKTTL
ncbi:MAG TPA: GNVR domain-containing protein, partial [Oligoflexia bacterium]|nr:GNVR domain-containing protein [Oligoflexia bacterium]